MLVRATRTLSAWTLGAIFYVTLFAVVVIVHVALTTALRAQGWDAGAALFVSGAAVLTVVVGGVYIANGLRELRSRWRERRRIKQNLPDGPCCVIWRAADGEFGDDAMPWDVVGPLRARYPRLARRLGVEGVAIADFEIAAGGRVKNIHCVDAWPSDVFYEAAREALAHARFEPKPDVHPRFGASFRMPFVFRISGASKLKEAGRRARPLRPKLQAAAQAVERLRGAG